MAAKKKQWIKKSIVSSVNNNKERLKKFYSKQDPAVKKKLLNRAEVILSKLDKSSPLPNRSGRVKMLRGMVLAKQGNHSEAYEAVIAANDGKTRRAELHHRAGVYAKKAGRKEEALSQFEAAVHLEPGNGKYVESLIKAMGSGVPEWRRYQLLSCLGEQSTNPLLLEKLANSAFRLDRFDTCTEVLERYAAVSPLKRPQATIAARAYYRLGKIEKADAILQAVLKSTKDPVIRARGTGHFIQTSGDWQAAEALYKFTWQSRTDAEVAFGVAYALDRQYKFEESVEWYRKALSLPGGDRPYWNYKLGHALEACDDYRSAVPAYSRALDLGQRRQKAWLYRLGAVLYKLGRYDQSLECLKSWAGIDFVSTGLNEDNHSLHPLQEGTYLVELDEDWMSRESRHFRESTLTDADISNQKERWLFKARESVKNSEPDDATENYNRYLMTVSSPDYPVIGEYIDLLSLMDRDEDACRILLESAEFAATDGINIEAIAKSQFDRRRLRYAENCKRFAIDKKVALFESYWGTKTNDNPLAVYESMLADPRFADWTFYWSHQSGGQLSTRLQDEGRTRVIEYGSQAYDRVLSSAGVVVTNTSLVEYFARRDDQIVVNTWHGTPMKTLGRSIGTGVLEHANVARGLVNTSILFMPNEHTANALVDDYDVKGVASSKVVVGGSPRLDIIGHTTEELREETLNALGLNPTTTDRIVFYAPTWRGSDSERSMDVSAAIAACREMSRIPGITVLFRAHHLAEAALKEVPMEARIVPNNVDTYDVLSVTDVLVTDYSSLLFDFLPTGRRVISFAHDLEEYAEERGFYVQPTEIVSDVAVTVEDLVSMVEDDSWSGPDAKYVESQRKYSSKEDGGASKRCLDEIIDFRNGSKAGMATENTPGPQTVVVFESLLPNGIFSALTNLVRLSDPSKFRFVLVTNKADIISNEVKLASMEALSADAAVIGRVGSTISSSEERYALAEYSRNRGRISPRMSNLVDAAYQREFRRVFGTPKDAVFLDFEGYNWFWNTLIARGTPESCRSAMIMHNQMADEWEEKFPYLSEVFVNLTRFTAIGAVSTVLAEENQRRLQDLGFEIGSDVLPVHNLLDGDGVEARSTEGENLWNSLEASGPRLVSVGRFSPEKNQELVLRAFAHILKNYPEAKLMFLGQGPTLSTLELLTDALGLTNSVVFAGFVDNPMPTIAGSDVFVLGSLHEGLPMVLLEAMALDVPSVCTPVPGSVEAIDGRGGLIGGWTPDEIAGQIDIILRSGFEVSFDVESFNEVSQQEFSSLVSDL